MHKLRWLRFVLRPLCWIRGHRWNDWWLYLPDGEEPASSGKSCWRCGAEESWCWRHKVGTCMGEHNYG